MVVPVVPEKAHLVLVIQAHPPQVVEVALSLQRHLLVLAAMAALKSTCGNHHYG